MCYDNYNNVNINAGNQHIRVLSNPRVEQRLQRNMAYNFFKQDSEHTNGIFVTCSGDIRICYGGNYRYNFVVQIGECGFNPNELFYFSLAVNGLTVQELTAPVIGKCANLSGTLYCVPDNSIISLVSTSCTPVVVSRAKICLQRERC